MQRFSVSVIFNSNTHTHKSTEKWKQARRLVEILKHFISYVDNVTSSIIAFSSCSCSSKTYVYDTENEAFHNLRQSLQCAKIIISQNSSVIISISLSGAHAATVPIVHHHAIQTKAMQCNAMHYDMRNAITNVYFGFIRSLTLIHVWKINIYDSII